MGGDTKSEIHPALIEELEKLRKEQRSKEEERPRLYIDPPAEGEEDELPEEEVERGVITLSMV